MVARSLCARSSAGRWAAGALVAGALAVRLWGLGRESLWFDEAYSLMLARWPVRPSSIVDLVGPVYTLFLHCWLWLGEADWLVRLPSALFGTATVYVIYRLGAALWDEATGLVAGLLLAASPMHVWYSQEARMYALVTGLAATSSWLFWGLGQRRSAARWAGYVVASVLTVYSHSLAVLVLAVHNLCVAAGLAWRRAAQPAGRPVGCQEGDRVPGWRLPAVPLRPWLLSQVVVAVLCLPWVYATFVRPPLGGYWGWIEVQYGPATWQSVLNLLAVFAHGGRVAWPALVRRGLLVAFVGLSLIGAVRWQRQGRRCALDGGWAFAAALFALPVALVLAVSQVRNVFVPRYLMPFLPGFVLLVARGVRSLPGRVPGAAALAGVLAISAVAVGDAYLRQEKEDWRGVAGRIAALEQPLDMIFLMDEDIVVPFRHYYRGPAAIQTVWRGRDEPEVLRRLVDEAVEAHSRVWLVLAHTQNYRLKEQLLADPRLRLAFEEARVGIYLARFDRRP